MKKLLAVACLLALVATMAQAQEKKVLAKIGDQVITETDLNEKLAMIQANSPMRGMALTPEQKKMLLEQMVVQAVLGKAAKDAGTALTPEAVKQLDMMKEMMVIKQYVDVYLKNNPAKEDELKKYYDAHPAWFCKPEERKLWHIVAKDKAAADKAAKELKAGKKFDKVASATNTDFTKTKGGDMGWMQKGMMGQEFDDAAFTLKKGAVSGVVKTPSGYQIIKVEDIRESKTMTFDEVKDQIGKAIEEEKVRSLIDDLKVKYKVVINEPAPETQAEKPAQKK